MIGVMTAAGVTIKIAAKDQQRNVISTIGALIVVVGIMASTIAGSITKKIEVAMGKNAGMEGICQIISGIK